MPGREKMPSTLRRSPAKAQRTWAKAHDSAAQTYGEGERAHRTAFSAVKHSFEKAGDRWVPKRRKGPSDPRARKGGAAARAGKGETFGGVDYQGRTRQELTDRARRLGIAGASRMDKKALARALQRQAQRATRASRERSAGRGRRDAGARRRRRAA
jgi:cation transport regulator ChaB